MGPVSNSTLAPTMISAEDCWEAVHLHLQTSDFNVVDMSVKPFSDCPGGFLGDHWRIKVHVLLIGEPNQVKELQFFAKTIPPKQKDSGNYTQEMGAFHKETGLLETLLSDLKKLTKEKIAEVKDPGFRPRLWTCESYVVRPQYIILEDLSESGFVTPDKKVFFDFQHCRVLLETLASFHAASIIYEEKRSKLLGRSYSLKQDFRHLLFETLLDDRDEHPGKTLFMVGFRSSKAFLDLIPKYGKHSKNHKTIADRFLSTYDEASRLAKESDKFRNVLCHGDVWANNTLFRYENNQPVECRLVDFQLVRYAPPATDVMMALHYLTTRELREAHLEELLALYHQRLVEEVEADVLPWAQFRASCVEAATFARVVVAGYLATSQISSELLRPVLTNPTLLNHFLTKDRTPIALKAFREDVDYRKRNTEALEELVEHCIVSTSEP